MRSSKRAAVLAGVVLAFAAGATPAAAVPCGARQRDLDLPASALGNSAVITLP